MYGNPASPVSSRRESSKGAAQRGHPRAIRQTIPGPSVFLARCEDDAHLKGELGITAAGYSPGRPDVDRAGLIMMFLALYVLRGCQRASRCLPVLLASLLVTSTATAQLAHLDTTYPVEQFRRAGEPPGILDVEWGGGLAYQVSDVGIWLSYADDPLNAHHRMDGNRERTGSLVGRRISGALASSVSLWSWLQLGLGAQVALSQEQDAGAPTSGASLATAGAGELRVTPRAQVLRQASHGIDLAVAAGFTAPGGASEIYLSDSSMTFVPEVMLARAFTARLRGGMILGYRLRKRYRVLDVVMDDELYGHAGVGYQVTGALALETTLAAAARAGALLDRGDQSYGEARSALSYTLGRWTAFAAAGAWWQGDIDTSGWRVVAGVRLEPAPAMPVR